MEHGKEAQNHPTVADKEHGKDEKDYTILLVHIEMHVV